MSTRLPRAERRAQHHLYRAVLGTVIGELARAFEGVDVEAVRLRGSGKLLLPVARSHPDALRLLWRHASHEPDFADHAVGFRSYVTRPSAPPR